MRSTFSGLNTMVLGIYANQVSQETVGHNITNANTEGYSRQSVNLAAIRANQQPSLYGNVLVGAGVDSMSLTRARDIFADRQYWTEKATSVYLDTRQVQYQKLESIFDDTIDNNIEKALENFYDAWETLSVDASVSSPRINVLGKANTFADYVHTAAQKLQEQINTNYADMSLNVTKMNTITKQITQLNKAITSAEATGAMANDLRDQRDLLTDELSTYTNINVYENDLGMYQIVSNGITLVDGIHSLTLQMSKPLYNNVYGVSDYVIQIKETTGLTYVPENGAMKALADAIAEDKEYIDKLADMSAFMLTTLNDVHKQGIGIDQDETAGLNFYGDDNTVYTWGQSDHSSEDGVNGFFVKATRYNEHWDTIAPSTTDGIATFSYNGEYEVEYLQGINIINELDVNLRLLEPDGEKLVAARSWGQITYDETSARYPTTTTLNTYSTIISNTTTATEVGTTYVRHDYSTANYTPGVSTVTTVSGIPVGYNLRSVLDGGLITCCDADDFECSISVNSDGTMTFTCTQAYDPDENANFVGHECTLTDPDSQGKRYIIVKNAILQSDGSYADYQTDHFVHEVVDAGGKHYTISSFTADGSDYKWNLRDDEDTRYTISNSGVTYTLLETGEVVSMKENDTGKTTTFIDMVEYRRTHGETSTTYTTVTYTVPSVITDMNGTPIYDAVYEANGTGDGSLAVRLAALFNIGNDNREPTAPLGTQSINSFYNKSMTQLGSDAEATNMKIEAQEEVLLQIEEWRSSTSGVNWNEELTNMLKFQQGFSACSRCLTTMDEMLDRLINSTGMVGR